MENTEFITQFLELMPEWEVYKVSFAENSEALQPDGKIKPSKSTSTFVTQMIRAFASKQVRYALYMIIDLKECGGT